MSSPRTCSRRGPAARRCLCAAIDLRTLLRHGLTRRDGTWVLA